ncbi:DNA-processing protein DprA [Microbacterium sp. NPDC055910]|uniref:DNA-processing protein DprA n=1 Tax=Microbacterium sp. NPDC055910 TaxID=3345659 RepID=UPI0035DBF123
MSTPTNVNLEARAAWSVLTEPGDTVAGGLVAAIGYAEALTALENPAACITAIMDADAASTQEEAATAVQRWLPRMNSRTLDFALREAQRHGIQMLDPDAVPGVADLGILAPHVLWVRGDLGAAVTPLSSKIALVGARAATNYGDQVTRELTTDLVGRGITIVSGAAYGIDATAHRAALWNDGHTIAWLANGVDRAYPAGNRDLIDRIATHAGCAVISEIPPGSAPTRHRFLSRNRLVAATAAATVVVEAGWRSGSLTTANHAAILGRGLGAVPGPISSPASSGCHRLIRECEAQIVTGPDDAYELLRPTPVRG